MTKPFQLLILGLLIAILAACGGDDDSDDNGDNNDTTANNTPAAIADTDSDNGAPSATNLELTETFTTNNLMDGELTFSLPAGWTVDESLPGIVAIYSEPDVAQGLFRGLQSEQIAIQILRNSITNPDEAVTDHLSTFASTLDVAVDTPEPLSIGDKAAARVDGSSSKYHVMSIAIVWDDTYIDVNTYTNPDEFAQYEQTLLDIINSIQYTAGVQ